MQAVLINAVVWVFNCVHIQIFISSLLCSGNLSHIKLASRMTQQSGTARSRSASPNTLPRDAAGENVEDFDTVAMTLRTKLSHDELAELVLVAAREYFDACATLDDPDLELARQE